jgi:hypothetical protein
MNIRGIVQSAINQTSLIKHVDGYKFQVKQYAGKINSGKWQVTQSDQGSTINVWVEDSFEAAVDTLNQLIS